MLGVICAMELEASGLISLMDNIEEVDCIGYKFTRGKIRGKEITVVISGIGKGYAAAVTALLIHNFGASEVINLGVCGGTIGTGKVIIADSVVQYDFDTTVVGDELGQLEGFDSPYIKCSKEIADKLGGDTRGVIASGDKFIAKEEEVEFLVKHFGAIGFDMESGAVAQICAKAGVKFAVVRVVSDGGDAGDYAKFKVIAAKKGVDTVLKYLG